MKRLHWLLIDGATAFGGHEVMLMRFVEELAHQRRVVPHVLAREGTRLRRPEQKVRNAHEPHADFSQRAQKHPACAARCIRLHACGDECAGSLVRRRRRVTCWQNLCSPRWRVQWVSA